MGGRIAPPPPVNPRHTRGGLVPPPDGFSIVFVARPVDALITINVSGEQIRLVDLFASSLERVHAVVHDHHALGALRRLEGGQEEIPQLEHQLLARALGP